MHKEWKEIILGECCEFINGGSWSDREYVSKGVPVIKVTNMVDGSIDFTNLSQIPESSLKKYEKHLLKEGDLIVATVGSHPTQPNSVVGRTSIVPARGNGHLLNQNAVCIRVNDEQQLDERYLGYLTKTTLFKHFAATRGKGSANQVRLAISELKKFTFPAPSLPTQRRIAALLSAYDELIENNNRRIRLLEEMARQLYREWFVRLRFPGWREVRVVKGVPVGWKIQRLHEVSSLIKRGIAPKYDEDGGSQAINQRCIRDSKIQLDVARKQSKKIPKEKLVRFGDVLINSTGVGTLGRVAQVYKNLQNCTVDTHVTIARPKTSMNPDYYGFALIQLQSYFELLAVGSTGQTELGRETISKVQILIPPEAITNNFSQIVKPMRMEIEILLEKNTLLRQTRDLLLPRLISGQLKV